MEAISYSPLDQINKDNFGNLQVAWRFNTNNLGPHADRLYSATPLLVNGTLYTTAGTARSVVALNPGTGQMLWMYQLGARDADCRIGRAPMDRISGFCSLRRDIG